MRIAFLKIIKGKNFNFNNITLNSVNTSKVEHLLAYFFLSHLFLQDAIKRSLLINYRTLLSQIHTNSKRKSTTDEMDTEIEDPELIFELPDHHVMGNCQCACENAVYGSAGYAACLQVNILYSLIV